MWRCCIPGTANPVGVLVERVAEAQAASTPHLHRLVIRRRHQFLAVMGESDAAYSRRVGFEHFGISFAVTDI